MLVIVNTTLQNLYILNDTKVSKAKNINKKRNAKKASKLDWSITIQRDIHKRK